jgi:MFS family permease
MSKNQWRNRDIWSIALSAGFADVGYQSVLAVFPLFLVIQLHAPVWQYGLAMALSYGGGAIFSLLGSRLGDRIGHKKTALIGNCLIPLLSFSALIANPAWAIGLLTGGWWARNFRSPSRRVMLSEAIKEEEHRTTVFGFLHALDVGGGATAALLVIIALHYHLQFKYLFLLTVIPLAASSLSLTRASTGQKRHNHSSNQSGDSPKQQFQHPKEARAIYAASALYGFTFYSIGFPVLTVAQKTKSDISGIISFLVFQAVSAATGYLLAKRFGKSLVAKFVNLGILGYFVSGIGAVVLILDIHFRLGLPDYLVGLAVLGFALGVIETLEPSLISVVASQGGSGRGFGALSSSRSVGLFVGNIVMGLLYQIGPSWSYTYAAVIALAAAVIVLAAARKLRNEDPTVVSS